MNLVTLNKTLSGLTVPARWFLGGLFIYMGLTKALHPVEFLKLIHQYNLTNAPVVLNFIAATLPWFEVLCGVLLLTGVAVRGAALVVLLMLAPFTIVVFRRALAIHSAQAIAFCAIKFDCGCGNGEVRICRKLAENSLLVLLSAWLLFGYGKELCLRYSVWQRRKSQSWKGHPRKGQS